MALAQAKPEVSHCPSLCCGVKLGMGNSFQAKTEPRVLVDPAAWRITTATNVEC